MPRRYGPTRGAGTVVVEKDVQNGISPAPFGSTAYVGQVERGDIGEVSICVSSADYIRKHGTYMDGTEVPNCAVDFFGLNGGAGSLSVVRVTDGNEVASEIEIFSRHIGLSESQDRILRRDQRVPLFKVKAKNGGSWGGRTKVVAFTPSAFTDTKLTLASGETLPVDLLKGASVRVLQDEVETSFKVTGNTASEINLEGSSLFKTECDEASIASPNCLAQVDAMIRPVNALGMVSGARQALAVAFKDGETNSSETFGMDVFVDGGLVRSYATLSLDPTSEFYLGNIISEDSENHFIEVSDIFEGEITSRHRPASFAGAPVLWSGRELVFAPIEVNPVLANVSNSSKGRVSRPIFGAQAIPMKMVVTFDANEDATVQIMDRDGLQILDSMDDEKLGFEASYSFDGDGIMKIEPPFGLMSGVEIHQGKDGFEEGDRFELVFNPFPTEQASGVGLLDGSMIDPFGQRVGIATNSANRVTLKASFATPPEGRSFADESFEVLSFSVAPDADIAEILDTTVLKLSVESSLFGGVVEENIGRQTIGGVVQAFDTIEDLVANFNHFVSEDAKLSDLFGSNPFKVVLTDDSVPASGGKLIIDLQSANSKLANRDSLEAFMKLSVQLGVQSGLSFAEISSASLSVGADLSSIATASSPFVVYAPLELRGGSNGGTPTASDFIEAFNTETSPLNRLRGQKLGLVKLACPAITDASVQKAGVAYAEARNYQFRVEIPYSVQSETGAVSYVNATIGRNNYAVTSFPSRAHIVNPLGSGVIEQSLTGMIHGREASIAGNFDGYHKASAGESATLPSIVRLPWKELRMNEEITNPVGLNLIKKVSGNFVLWGDRTLSQESGWKWKHQREYMSHVENTLLESFDGLIFGINDRTARAGLVTIFQMFFIPEYQKRALRGATFDEAVSIKIDDENNTDLSMSNGELNAEIELRLAETIERFIISVSKAGVRTNIG
jgi:hypothetical protein